ncbi:AMP-binding protein [Priestia koreensis]|uniref:AMP-binding protein n=1 Tax=Priestia koreensis TaxID=284581 RepID=UPI00203AB871|nr:AMP-binding protein [Priestia koreensis]MCM3004382.1 AMP-binding protein [Priestia koreensis]
MLKNQTIGQLLKETASLFKEKEAIVYSKENIRYTYQEFYDATTLVAKALLNLGIKKGEHIAIWATNVPEWILLQFASARIGAVLVTINTSYQEHELEYLLKQSDTSTLFFIDEFKTTSYLSIVEKLYQSKRHSPSQLPALKNFIRITSETTSSFPTWSQFLDGHYSVTDEELSECEQLPIPSDVINMQYTSGTTGFPKGVMLTHHNIVNNGFLVAQSMGLRSTDILCIPVPLFHCFGCVMSTLASVSVGATMAPVIEFDPEVVLQTVEKEKCTALQGVPTMFISELNHPNFKQYDLSTLRTGIMAGSPCPIEVMKKVMNEMNMTDITIAYGQTESSPVITQTTPLDSIMKKVETVGKVHPHVEIKIVDPITNETVNVGEQGELCTRGYLVMKGYYKMPEATDSAIDEDGWLHTGDLATADSEGYIKITGRLKDMIIRGGENVYPREIEEFLYQHPSIFDVQVIGVPDEKYGERVGACIILKDNCSVTEQDIKEFCRGKIAHYKIPEYILFVSEFPMTASGKIQKYKLREGMKDYFTTI